MIKILVVDNERLQQGLLNLLGAQSHMQVVATAQTCDEALEVIEKFKPNIALVGHHPPQQDGLEITRRVMEQCPLPLIVITGTGSPGEVATSFDAVEAGALAVLPRPRNGVGPAAQEPVVREFLQTIRVMSEVKVIRRWPKMQSHSPRPAKRTSPGASRRIKVVAIGASTGGPIALATLLGNLPKDFPAPVMVVQHMANGFIRGFVDWLAPSSALPVHIATQGEYIYPGHAYMAPDGAHMEIASGNKIKLREGPPEHGVQPSVASLFRSVCQIYGKEAAAVLLTGMGRDGAAELLLLKQQGALTFAQDKESSIVHGMPGEAIKLGAALHILKPDEIASVLTEQVTLAQDNRNNSGIRS